MRYSSPLRYPGGKSRLANFMKIVFLENSLIGGHYAEAYAGGAGVGLFLVIEGYAEVAHLNDLDRSIYAFWHAVTKTPDDLCQLIEVTGVNIVEWKRQRAIQKKLRGKRGLRKADLLKLGFSTFFLNRTNRSGIIRGGGVIGGLNQEGKWGIRARYNKEGLVERIQRIAKYRDRIRIYNWDAAQFLKNKVPELPCDSLVYLDPPYYNNGDNLYQNDYTLEQHSEIADLVTGVNQNWIVSYDNASEIKALYHDYNPIIYDLSYSARRRYEGSEVMFACKDLKMPDFENPARISKDQVHRRRKHCLSLDKL